MMRTVRRMKPGKEGALGGEGLEIPKAVTLTESGKAWGRATRFALMTPFLGVVESWASKEVNSIT